MVPLPWYSSVTHQVAFLAAAEHAHIPAPIEQDGFQVLRPGCRGVRRRAAASAAARSSTASGARAPATLSRPRGGSAPGLRQARGRRADRQGDSDRDTGPKDLS